MLFGFGAVKTVHSSMASWWRHNDGQLALILLRGPASFCRGAAHELFVDARYNTVRGGRVGDAADRRQALAAITRRKRCPLALPAWKTVPWEAADKSLKDKLIDILVDVPGLMEDVDAFKMGRITREEILAAHQTVKKDLHAWEAEMGNRLTTYDYTHKPELAPPRCDDDVALLHLSNVYWGICLAVHSTAAVLPRPSASSASSASSTGSGTLRQYACKIARSVHLLFEPIAGDFGCNVALFPLLSAWRFFTATEPDSPSEEQTIVMRLLGREFQGARVSSFARNMQTPKS